MENTIQQYLLIIALAFGMSGLTAEAVEDQSTEGATLIPRPVIKKPVHTVVNESYHQTGKISVKFREGLLIRLREGALTDFGTGALHDAQDVLTVLAGATWRRVHSVPEATLDQWQQMAESNSGRAAANLNLYFNLYLPEGADAGAAIDALNGLDCVEYALPVPLPAPPPSGHCDPECVCTDGEYCEDETCVDVPDFGPDQGYLDVATDGIDAECAWMVPGGTGAGIKIVDIEYDWNLDHCDLNATLIGPQPTPSFPQHGTNVLGEIGSIDNGWGTTGIAYDSTIYVATHCHAQACNDTDEVDAAISTAIFAGNLGPGDVILLEVQINGPSGPPVPAEWWGATYDAIWSAVHSHGITVVEAAGNGGLDLDAPEFCPPTGPGSHCPFRPENDSGAIIVGAGNSPVPGAPGRDLVRANPGSNYGSTVDLQAWGDSIATTGLQSGFPVLLDVEGENLDYTSYFGATSGASAIVAGACALLQSAYKQATGTVLTPQQVRDCLHATGSPQQPSDPPFCSGTPECENIGPRPDVAAAIASALPCLDCNANQTPDVCDIASGFSLDLDLDGVPDECCIGDLSGDGAVDAEDLAILLGSWGPCFGCPGCLADLTCDGVVDAADLAILLGSWGPCRGPGPMPPPDGPEGPGDGCMTLDQALEVMGFADVDEFNAWTASVPTDEAHTATQQLLELLTQ